MDEEKEIGMDTRKSIERIARRACTSLAAIVMLVVSAGAAEEASGAAGEQLASAAPEQPVVAAAPESGADAPAEEPERVGVVTVTAPPIVEGARVERSGTQVTSVSAEQVDGLNAQDLTGAVRRVPGVVISRYNEIGSFGGGDGGAVFIRGHGAGRPGAEISTRIDGIPRFAGMWTHPLMDTMDIDMAERIDIYKSAQPVTFGNMSFGAINLIPKRRTEPGFSGKVSAAYGSFNTLILRGEHGGMVDAYDYYVTASHRQSDGHRRDADGEVDGFYGRMGMAIEEHWYASALIDHTSGDVGDPGVKGSPRPPLRRSFETSDGMYILGLSHDYDGVGGEAKVYLQDGEIHWNQWDFALAEPFDSNTSYDNYGLRLKEAFELWEGGELTIGYDHDVYDARFRERRPSGDRSKTDANFYNASPWALVSQSILPAQDVEVTPSAGVRYNASRYFGDDLGGQAGVVARFAATELHANYAHAYNVPGAWTVATFNGFGRPGQWKELDAEVLDHTEVGISQTITEWLRAGVTWFYDDVHDALRFVPPPPPPPTFENLGRYRNTGPEVSLEITPRDDLKFFAGATHSHCAPGDTPNIPEWTAVAGAAWSPLAPLTLQADFEWLDDRYVLNERYAATQAKVGDVFLVNARADWKLTKHAKVFVAGANLLDEDYEYRLGYPMPGASVMGGLELTF